MNVKLNEHNRPQAYQPPRLREFGDIVNLTGAGKTNPGFDASFCGSVIGKGKGNEYDPECEIL